MKFVFYINIFLLTFTMVVAQEKSVRKLKSYAYNSSIEIDSNKKYCIISCDKIIDTIALQIKNNLLTVKKISDTLKISVFKFSNENVIDIQNQYDTINNFKYQKIPLFDKIINRANDKGGVIKFVNDAKDKELNNINNPIIDDENNLQPKQNIDSSSNIWMWILGGLIALLTGIIIYLLNKNKSKQENSNQTINNLTSQPDNVKQNLQSIDALKNQLQLLQTQFNNYKDFDAAYFENALTQFVNPIQHALNKGNKQEVMSIATQIITQYIAITHLKTERRQVGDDYIINTIIGDNKSNEKIKVHNITSNSPADEMPIEIKTLLQILKENNASIPNSLSYMGYNIIK